MKIQEFLVLVLNVEKEKMIRACDYLMHELNSHDAAGDIGQMIQCISSLAEDMKNIREAFLEKSQEYALTQGLTLRSYCPSMWTRAMAIAMEMESGNRDHKGNHFVVSAFSCIPQGIASGNN